MLLEKDMAQINHNSAANALRDLVHIYQSWETDPIWWIFTWIKKKNQVLSNILLN